MLPHPSRIDADTPPDGDFASYVERLTRQPAPARPPGDAAVRGAQKPPGAVRPLPRPPGAAARPSPAAPASFWQRVWHALQQAAAASSKRK
ncbi:hypothetical protein [Acidovorax sp. Leaf160]|uniref:hypothetical protein n=1 Tax=Acidovorax sp. Leaf160 TaxID=1736280 RepID=UPI000A546D08|nr:hypothetical protein [Acidovorax sp. Leaf160]